MCHSRTLVAPEDQTDDRHPNDTASKPIEPIWHFTGSIHEAIVCQGDQVHRCFGGLGRVTGGVFARSAMPFPAVYRYWEA